MPLSRATSRPLPTNSMRRPRRCSQIVPEDRAEQQRVIEAERHAEQTVDDHRVDQRLRHAADGLLIAEPQRQAMHESPDAHRDDQRIHAEIEDEKAVDQRR